MIQIIQFVLCVLVLALTTVPVHKELLSPELIDKWGAHGSGNGEFNRPLGITISQNGLVYIADYQNHRIQVFEPDGTFVRKWGSQGSGDGQFISPTSITISSDGLVYVGDSANHRVQVFEPDGTFVRKWGGFGQGDGQFHYAYCVTLDSDGLVYVTDNNNHRVQVFEPDGTFVRKWGSRGSGDGQFNRVGGVAIGPDGLVYVVDHVNHRIQVFEPDGTFVRKWGSHGSDDGQLYIPESIAIDSNGLVYIADAGNHRIQVFEPTGTFVQKWGVHGSGNGEFESARNIAVDDFNGLVYITDDGNHRVQVFSLGQGFMEWYVSPDGDNKNEGTSWTTAKQTIQAAVDVASAGDVVWVTNGVYESGATAVPNSGPPNVTVNHRVAISNAITVRSVNGPDVTIIKGGNDIRCVGLVSNATIIGFSLVDAFMTKTIAGGGAASLWQGQSDYGIVRDCIISNNVSYSGGAGAQIVRLENCVITHNRVLPGTHEQKGGGINGAYAYNCLIKDNYAPKRGGGANESVLYNCTLVNNVADACDSDNVDWSTLWNCVVWGGNDSRPYQESTYNYSCSLYARGGNNITNDPLFVDFANGNYRLRASSPCINAGANLDQMNGATDLDGNPRILGGTVDMGAYEYPKTISPAKPAGVSASDGTSEWYVVQHTLTYNAGANGSISGTTPQKVNHGGSGSQVTAVPDIGSHLVKWNDGSTDNPRRDINVTEDISVTAIFAINKYTLTYRAGANGLISGITPQKVNYGDRGASVTAVPHGHSRFTRWSDGSIVNPRRDINVTADITVTAEFTLNPPAVPTGLSVSDEIHSGKIRVSWDPVDGADSYEIWRRTAHDPGAAVKIVSGITDTRYDDTDIAAETTYYYWIKAVNSAGVSDFSLPDFGTGLLSD